MKRYLYHKQLCTYSNIRQAFNVNSNTFFKYGHYSAAVAVMRIILEYLYLLANLKRF